jgi:peptide/nickel transport system permease protein
MSDPSLTIPDRPTAQERVRAVISIVFASKVGSTGLGIILFWLLVGVLSLVWTPYQPTATDFVQNLKPALSHPLGTDHLGRDLMSRLMAGTQIILIKTRLPGGYLLPGGVAIWGVFGSLLFGTFLGLNAGYRGGWLDQIIMQFLDALIAFPRIVLYLIVISSLGQGDLVVILAITVTGTPGIARLVRGLALDIKSRDYVQAARTRGENTWYIMYREILPNAKAPLVVDATLRVGYAIFTIGTLGFLGIGLPPPDPDWGNMVNEGRRYIFANPLAVLWPSAAISSLVVGLNLFADGLQEETTRFQK